MAVQAPQQQQKPTQGAPAGGAAAPNPAQGPEQRPASPPRVRVGKFRLLAGDAVEDQLNWLPEDRVRQYAVEAGIPDAATLRDNGFALGSLRAAVRASRAAERRWKAGQVIASPKQLASRWPEKYARVGDDVPESPGEPTLRRQSEDVEESYTEAAVQQQIEEQVQDDLHRLNLGQLRELAYQEGIDLGQADGKAAVLAVIRRTRRAVAEDR